MNYDNITLLLKMHAGRNDKQLIDLAWFFSTIMPVTILNYSNKIGDLLSPIIPA